MRSEFRDYEILRDIDLRIAQLQNSHDSGIRELRTDLRLHIQENRFHRGDLMKRLEKLEEKAGRPIIDWTSLIQNFWFKVIIFLALATGNTQLIDLVSAAFQK